MKTIMPILPILALATQTSLPVAAGPAGDEVGSVTGRSAATTNPSAFNDSGWTLLYREDFDSGYTATDSQTFGQIDWLIYQLINGSTITVANGYAQLNAPDFWNVALIRSTHVLPDEYKVRTKIGYINYDVDNYEQADYDHPDFNTHNGYYENGMYFLTVTDDTCVGHECAEYWWHYHRTMVIDIDNHFNAGGGQEFHPFYMVYMAPETNSGGNLRQTWDGSAWDPTDWNWNVAYTYEYDTWYYAEPEKRDGYIILRLYDENQTIIEETTPVDISLVNAMDDSTEFLYVGEPHTDDYEGDARIDEITLLIPETHCCDGLRGNVDGLPGPSGDIDVADITYLVAHLWQGGPAPTCVDEGNVNGLEGPSGPIDVSDLSYLVAYVRQGGPAPAWCP